MDFKSILDNKFFKALKKKCEDGQKTMSQNPKNLLASKGIWFIIIPLLVVLVFTLNSLVLLVVGTLLGRWSTKYIKIRGKNGNNNS